VPRAAGTSTSGPAGALLEAACESRVNLLLEMSDGPRQLVLGPQYKVKPVPDFFAEAKALLGEAAVL
jgi:hypothetical protein